MDLLSEDPLIIVAIDEKTEELQEALTDLRGEVRVIEFKTFRREGVSEELNAYVFEPVVGAKTPSFVRTNPRISNRGIGGAVYALFDAKGVDNVAMTNVNLLPKNKARYQIQQLSFQLVQRGL